MLKKIIIILSLFIVLFILWMVFQKFFRNFSPKSMVTVEYHEIDPGRLILGKKISIRDGIKIPLSKYVIIEGQTATILGNFDLGIADNLYRKIEESFYVEEGYFTDQIVSTERMDSLVGGEIKSSHLRIQLPLPDTLQFFGINFKEKDIAPFFMGFMPGERTEAQLDTIRNNMKKDAYIKWKSNWTGNLQENLEFTALTLSNYLSEAARIAQTEQLKSVTSIFNFETDQQIYHVEIRCMTSGGCQTIKREIKENQIKD